MKGNLLTILLFVVCASLITLKVMAVPGVINYQGTVSVQGSPFTGTGHFQFALVDQAGTTTYWSTGDIGIYVTKGLYAVKLGEAPEMSAIPASVFDNDTLLLRVWFDDGSTGMQQLSPDQQITSVGYSLKSENSNALEGHPAADFAIAGSVDADTLDGLDSLQFLRCDEDDEFDGNLILTGNISIGADDPQACLDLDVGSDTYVAVELSDQSWHQFRMKKEDTKLYFEDDWGGEWHSLLTLDSYRSAVGIGTSNPDAILDLVVGSDSYVATKFSGQAWHQFRFNKEDTKFHIEEDWGGEWNSLLTLDSYINAVGIGTSNPAYNLDVQGDIRLTGAIRDASGQAGSNGQILKSTGSGVNWIDAPPGSDDDWTISGSNVYRNTGNVGIGTTSPTATLEVIGDVKISLDLDVDDITADDITADVLDIRDVNASDDVTASDNITAGGKVKGAQVEATSEYICPSADLAEKLPIHPDYVLSEDEIRSRLLYSKLGQEEKDLVIKLKEISQLDPGTVVVITKDGVVPCSEESDTRLAGVISTQPAMKMASTKQGQYIALAGSVPCKVTGKINAGDMLTTSEFPGHAQKTDTPQLGAIVGKALEDFEGESGVVQIWIGG